MTIKIASKKYCDFTFELPLLDTQEQLAKKCGTTKSYISRIENDASDIRLSTLIRIIHQGLGGRLKLTVELNNKMIDFDL